MSQLDPVPTFDEAKTRLMRTRVKSERNFGQRGNFEISRQKFDAGIKSSEKSKSWVCRLRQKFLIFRPACDTKSSFTVMCTSINWTFQLSHRILIRHKKQLKPSMPTAGNPDNHSLVLVSKEILRWFTKLIKQSLNAGQERRFVMNNPKLFRICTTKNVLSTFCSLPSVSVNDD